jgi:hypothetical protein
MRDELEALAAIFKEFGEFCMRRGRVSEADTRATIIDRILHEVLGWPRPSVQREVSQTPGYLDYKLSTTRPVLVIEAKAAGESFEVPHRKAKVSTRLKINGVLRSNTKLIGALIQAQRYCVDSGIRYGVVTNGYSFVIFRAMIDGSSWRDGEAVVFDSPSILEADFGTFWNLIGYESVRSGRLDDAFRAAAAPARNYHRPLSYIVNADSTYSRNPINTALRPYVEKYFGDIAAQDDLELLDHCYIHSKPLQIIDQDLKMIIDDRIPRFVSNAVELLTDEEDQGGVLSRDLRAAANPTRQAGMVALLMGGIGSGKTTFLKRFFSIVTRDLLQPRGPAALAYLDFLGAPDVPALEAFLWSKLRDALLARDSSLLTRRTLEELCTSELTLIREAFGETEEAARRVGEALFALGNDPARFSERVLRYYILIGWMPIVVFDNVDQLGVETQAWIFTTAERFANHLGCVSILVMREESYCQAQLRRQLTAYTIRPYHLSSPNFREMIRVRIDFATRHAVTERSAGESTGGGVTPRIYQELLDFFEVLRRSVFDKNRNIARLIEAVSFGNMRIALDLFSKFITSGATNTPEILERFRAAGGYSVPFHQFAKSVILGDYRYYKESRSLILNVFDIGEARNSSHFTALRLLRFAAGGFGARKTTEAFFDLQYLVNAMVDVFDNEEDTLRTITKLMELGRQLVELDTRRCDTLEGATSLRITSAGQYYLHFLVKSFAYLDLIWNDTPIASSGLAERLARLMPETEMRTRFERVDLFLSYLHEEEQKELTDLSLPQSGGEFFYGPFMPEIQSQYESEKAFIRSRFRGMGQAID